jgi:tRNA U34 2-thiouridine synthase MnmA/TrmU
MASRKPKILMTMSGGVDSSVAAALLVRSGKYDVVGAYMLNYDNNQKGVESCWLPDYRDALRVAAQLGIPLMKLDFTKEYKETVLDYMFQEYEAGRTPNPDVLCNKFVKFGSWLDRAKALGCLILLNVSMYRKNHTGIFYYFILTFEVFEKLIINFRIPPAMKFLKSFMSYSKRNFAPTFRLLLLRYNVMFLKKI